MSFKSTFLVFVVVVASLTFLAILRYPGSRELTFVPSHVYRMWQAGVLPTPPQFLCSSLLQQAGSEPDLSLTFTDYTSYTSYPASHAPQVNGHFLSEPELDCLEAATELKDVASADKSTVTVLGGSSWFTLGSEVRVRIDVHTMGGRQKTQGGDALRIWLRDQQHRASAAGYVVDLLNGSYVGVLRALWVGQPEVVVALATPLEQIKLMYWLYATRGTLRELWWKFSRGNLTEKTWCFPYDPASVTTMQQSQTCDLSGENYGEEWYCRRPENLTCDDQTGYLYVAPFGPLPLTKYEKSLLRVSFHKNFRQVPKITVTSDTGESVVRATTPCHQRPWAATFLDTTPVGFFFQGTWHLRHCDVTARTPLQAYSPCLQNKTLYLFGDSTSRQLVTHVAKLLAMKVVSEDNRHDTVASKPAWNFSMSYVCHGLPFYGAFRKPVPFYLDHVPSDFSGLVFLTFYQHMASFHPRAFQGRVKATAQAVGRLLQRAPQVQVAVRGAHAYHHDTWDYAITHDDYWGKLYDRIWKEELFPWRDRVVFVDTWDMTMGGENFDCHPPGPFLDALVQSLLAYICPPRLTSLHRPAWRSAVT